MPDLALGSTNQRAPAVTVQDTSDEERAVQLIPAVNYDTVRHEQKQEQPALHSAGPSDYSEQPASFQPMPPKGLAAASRAPTGTSNVPPLVPVADIGGRSLQLAAPVPLAHAKYSSMGLQPQATPQQQAAALNTQKQPVVVAAGPRAALKTRITLDYNKAMVLAASCLAAAEACGRTISSQVACFVLLFPCCAFMHACTNMAFAATPPHTASSTPLALLIA